MLSTLYWWQDSAPRGGAENMAVDEWLAETADAPVLRCYRWEEGWGSCGYFIRQRDLPDWPVKWVRRWTGGGIVDHRTDFTYTIVAPRGHELAESRGAESYRRIHEAVAQALAQVGCVARLSDDAAVEPGGECFLKPVTHDLLGETGIKLAGAGQRRTKRGLLHQGSLATRMLCGREEVLAGALAEVVMPVVYVPEEEDKEWEGRVARYRSGEWMGRR